MSKEKEYILSRQLYKEFKSMNRRQPQNIYNQGVESVDLDELRKTIGSINGIGEKRLDEIMRVIDVFVNK